MKKTRKLVECAVLIAIATVLSLIKLVDLPYGGSITAASMLPMIIIAYRHGLAWGLGSGLVYGAIQQLTGLNTLSWVTTWQSILAVILLDYVIAFAGTGFGGVFRKKVTDGASALALGALAACVFRYACHVITGCTVWAGLSIPDSAALIYSFAYNATYMIPETIVTVALAYYLGNVLDFEKEIPVRKKAEKGGAAYILAGVFATVGLIADTVIIFSKLQDGETGDFVISNLSLVNWGAVGIITAVAILATMVCVIINKTKKAQ